MTTTLEQRSEDYTIDRSPHNAWANSLALHYLKRNVTELPRDIVNTIGYYATRAYDCVKFSAKRVKNSNFDKPDPKNPQQ